MPPNGSGSTSAHLNGHSASGPLFSPISPGVSDGVGKLVKLMDDAWVAGLFSLIHHCLRYIASHRHRQDHIKQINTSASEAQDLSPVSLIPDFLSLYLRPDCTVIGGIEQQICTLGGKDRHIESGPGFPVRRDHDGGQGKFEA